MTTLIEDTYLTHLGRYLRAQAPRALLGRLGFEDIRKQRRDLIDSNQIVYLGVHLKSHIKRDFMTSRAREKYESFHDQGGHCACARASATRDIIDVF